MQTVRAPAVAGSFYPADPSQLRETVARLLASAAYGTPPKALIAPHAGYVYSGPVAASAFRRVEDAPISRVVLLGPSHLGPLRGLALPGAAAMRTPLGDVPIEEVSLPQDRRAHAEEHSLEVELPFLQVALHSFTRNVGAVSRFATGDLIDLIQKDNTGRFDSLERRARDRVHVDQALFGRLTPDDACGAVPLNGLLLASKRRGLRPELIDLRNSGDTAGDKRRVVGYGAFAFYEK